MGCLDKAIHVLATVCLTNCLVNFDKTFDNYGPAFLTVIYILYGYLTKIYGLVCFNLIH